MQCKNFASITPGTDFTLALNSVGQSWISLSGYTQLALREGHDVLNSAYDGASSTSSALSFKTSETSGISMDPMLEVSYTYTTTTSTTDTVTYTYDHGMKRVSKASDDSTTLYPTGDYSVTDGTSTLYVSGTSGLTASVEDDGTTVTTQTLHTDHLGSTSVATDEDGIMIELLDYNPYGTERISWSSSSTDGEAEAAKTYIGEYSDDETSLSYLNARYYDPVRGQFLGQDVVFVNLGTQDKRGVMLLLDPQLMNSYQYGRGNPIAFEDSSGEFIETVFDLISIALSAYDYQHSRSFGSAVFLGLDILGGLAPGVPSAVGYARHVAQIAKISKYFGDVAGATGRVSDATRAAGLFAKNIGFKFSQRAWSMGGDLKNNIASLVGHYVKHGNETAIGATSVNDYYNKANNFVSSHKGFNDPFKNNGDQIHWDPNTNVKAITTKDGTIRSYYTETDPRKIDTYNKSYE